MATIRGTSNRAAKDLVVDNDKILQTGRPYSVQDRIDFINKNTRSISKSMISGRQDPTYLSFSLLFNWGELAGSSPFLSSSTEGDTAMAYLTKIRDFRRVEYLKEFHRILKKINRELPWYWQTLDGVNTLFQLGDMKDTYYGGDDAILKLGCLETIELPISGLMNLYRHIVYDTQNGRVVLPDNLLYFNFNIYISEIRLVKFNPTMKTDGKGTLLYNHTHPHAYEGEEGELTHYLIGENAPYFWFEVGKCKFKYDESWEYFGSLSKTNPEAATSSITIGYETVDLIESSSMPLFLNYKLNNSENYIQQATDDGVSGIPNSPMGDEGFKTEETTEEHDKARAIVGNDETLERLDGYPEREYENNSFDYLRSRDSGEAAPPNEPSEPAAPSIFPESELPEQSIRLNPPDLPFGNFGNPIEVAEPVGEASLLDRLAEGAGEFAGDVADQLYDAATDFGEETLSGFQQVADNVMDLAADYPQAVVDQAIQALSDKASGFVNALLLGNVYDLSTHTLSQALSQGSISGLAGLFSGDSGEGALESSNIYSEAPDTEALEPDNIYQDQSPPETPPLTDTDSVYNDKLV